MVKIVDKDQLNQGTEVVINTATKTIQLLIAGNLDDTAPGASSGVTLQAVYSFLKEEWKDDNSLNRFTFPLKAFTANEFQFINGWDWADGQTRELIRDAGWIEITGDRYAGMISLGSFDASTDQGYYQQTAGFDQTTTNFDKTGNVNEAVLIYNSTGPVDLTGFFKAFLRIQGKTYDSYDLLGEQGIPSLSATLYRFPLSNGQDLNISESDANIDANPPYTSMAVDYLTGQHPNVTTWAAATAYVAGDIVISAGGRYFRCTVGGTSAGTDADLAGGSDTGASWEVDPGERLIGSTYYHFDRIIDGASGTRFQIYEWGQRQLRKTTDINADTNADAFGVVNGNVADEFFSFRGADLILEEGVWIDNFASTEINNITFVPRAVDGAATSEVTFPFEVVVNFNFSQNIIDEVDLDTRGVLYFTNDDAGDDTGRDFDTALAIVVQNNVPANVDFNVASATETFSYDYDGNVQRGAASAATDAPVTLQMVGLAGFEILNVPFTIPRQANLNVNITASDERNFA